MQAHLGQPSAGGPGSSGAVAIDVVDRIDRAPWSGFQKSVLLLAALAVILDGLDNQLLGFAIPALIADWGVTPADFAPVVALSLVAMSIGTALAGFFGDSYGRRPTLIVCVATFGFATGAIAFVDDFSSLFALRLIAALGLGGAMPNATALLAEYTPLQRRSLAVTLGIVGVPVGGLLGGLIAAGVLPVYGWRALFLIGGILPLIVAAIMVFRLPESPSYLVRQPHKRLQLVQVLRRCGLQVADDAQFASATTGAAVRQPFLTLFQGPLLRDTLVLWLAFFSCLLCVYAVFNWAPTMLVGAGFDLAVASSGLAGFNLGGIAGALTGAWFMDRYGSRPTLITGAAGGAVVAVLMAIWGFDASAGSSPVLVVLAMALLGASINGVQVMLFALAAGVYPASNRATGVGVALAVGRVGAVASSYAGATVLGYGADAYFAWLAGAMLVVVVAVVLLKRHIIPARLLVPATLEPTTEQSS